MKMNIFMESFICCFGRIISSPTTPPSRQGKAPIVPCLLFSALHYGAYLSFSPKTLRIFGVPCLSTSPDKWKQIRVFLFFTVCAFFDSLTGVRLYRTPLVLIKACRRDREQRKLYGMLREPCGCRASQSSQHKPL